MVEQRRHQLEALLAASGDGEDTSRMSLICGLCVTELSVSGAGATVLSHVRDGNGSGPDRGLVHASSTVSAALEDLQLTVGEGPCLDTFESGGPVLVPDLAEAVTRWPGFTPGARDLGAAAVFSFPLQIGVVRLGSIDLYRDRKGSLTQAQLSDALILADLATYAVVQGLDGHSTEDLSWLDDAHIEVHQAAGMVQVQLNTTTDVALMRLRGYAYTHDLPVRIVAQQVVARTLRFTAES